MHVLIWAKHYSAAAINQEICFVYGFKTYLGYEQASLATFKLKNPILFNIHSENFLIDLYLYNNKHFTFNNFFNCIHFAKKEEQIINKSRVHRNLLLP